MDNLNYEVSVSPSAKKQLANFRSAMSGNDNGEVKFSATEDAIREATRGLSESKPPTRGGAVSASNLDASDGFDPVMGLDLEGENGDQRSDGEAVQTDSKLTQNDSEFYRKQCELAEQKLGEKKASKVRKVVILSLIGIITFLALLASAWRSNLTLGKSSQVKNSSTSAASVSKYQEIANSKLDVTSDVYTDIVKVTKFARLQDGGVVFYLAGKPKKFGKEIMFPVPNNYYNAVEDGSTIKIQYQILKVKSGDKVIDYVANVEVQTKKN